MKIIGHQKTIADLNRLVQSDKLPHALLFTGPAGIGKKLAAQHFAQKLFCSSAVVPANGVNQTSPPTPLLTKERGEGERSPCEHCSHCQRVAKLEHPDLLWIEPENEMIKIDPIRDLKKRLSLAPFESPLKVAILVDAHCLNLSASNALLKTLEEPPPNSLLILTTSLPHLLLKTILSRCQKIYFSPLSTQETKEVIEKSSLCPPLSKGRTDGFVLSEKLLSQIGGSPGTLLSFTEEVCDLVEQKVFPALDSTPKDLLKLLTVAEEIAAEDELHRPFLNLLAVRWKERILLNPNKNNFNKFDEIQNSLKLLKRNVNPLLTFENLFMSLCL